MNYKIFIKYAIVLSYFVQNKIILFLHRLFYRKCEVDNNIKKILIYRIGTIGDNIVTLPILRSIRKRFPDAKIDILADTGLKNSASPTILDILPNGYVNDVIFYRNFSPIELIKNLRKIGYDLYIELPENLWSLKTLVKHLLFSRVINVRCGIGFYKSVNLVFSKYQEEYIAFKNETERLYDILDLYGLVLKREYIFDYNFKESDRIFIEGLLERMKVVDRNRNVALVLGAKRVSNRWPVENFVEVAKFLISKGFNIFLIGGKDDEEIFDRFSDMLNSFESSKVFRFNFLTVQQSIYLFRFVKFTLTNDTGPMHMSYSVGTPVIVLYSTWQYRGMWYPLGEQNTVIAKKVDCSPCFINNCKDNLCMKKIYVDEVISTIERYI